MNIRKRTWRWQGEKHTAWVIDYKDGKRRRRQFATRLEAELYFSNLLKRKRASAYGVVTDITLKDFYPIFDRAKTWKSASYRERVRIAYEKSLARFHDLLLSDLTPEMIEEFKRDRLRVVKPWTVRNELNALSTICTMAIRMRYLGENPVQLVEKPPVPVQQDNPADYIPPDELDRLLAVAGQDGPLYLFAAATGLRVSELLALTWADVKDGFVTVRLGKGRKQRIVPLIPQAVAGLEEVPRKLKEPRVFWWVRRRDVALKRFKRRLGWAELTPSYTFHHLRHTYASYAAMAGVDLNVVAKTLGHSTTAITRRYAHLSPHYQRQEIQKMAAAWKLGARMAQGSAKPSRSKR